MLPKGEILVCSSFPAAIFFARRQNADWIGTSYKSREQLALSAFFVCLGPVGSTSSSLCSSLQAIAGGEGGDNIAGNSRVQDTVQQTPVPYISSAKLPPLSTPARRPSISLEDHSISGQQEGGWQGSKADGTVPVPVEAKAINPDLRPPWQHPQGQHRSLQPPLDSIKASVPTYNPEQMSAAASEPHWEVQRSTIVLPQHIDSVSGAYQAHPSQRVGEHALRYAEEAGGRLGEPTGQANRAIPEAMQPMSSAREPSKLGPYHPTLGQEQNINPSMATSPGIVPEMEPPRPVQSYVTPIGWQPHPSQQAILTSGVASIQLKASNAQLDAAREAGEFTGEPCLRANLGETEIPLPEYAPIQAWLRTSQPPSQVSASVGTMANYPIMPAAVL